MTAYAGGDATAFGVLFARYRSPLFTFLLHSTGRRALADDLFQEVFLRVVQQRHRYRSGGTFRAFLYTIARHALIDSDRKSRAKHRLAEETRHTAALVDEQEAPLERAAEAELNEQLTTALTALPDEQREVLLLRERAGLSFQEIATLTGSPLPTIKSRMRYALQGLRRELAEHLTPHGEVYR